MSPRVDDFVGYIKSEMGVAGHNTFKSEKNYTFSRGKEVLETHADEDEKTKNGIVNHL